MNSSKGYWEKKKNLELEVDEIMEKAQESPKYYGNTIKAMAGIGKSNSVLGESVGNRGDGPVFRENNHVNSHLHKKV